MKLVHNKPGILNKDDVEPTFAVYRQLLSQVDSDLFDRTVRYFWVIRDRRVHGNYVIHHVKEAMKSWRLT